MLIHRTKNIGISFNDLIPLRDVQNSKFENKCIKARSTSKSPSEYVKQTTYRQKAQT
ncbi:hypothetical protein SynMITS9220_01845 [Synechococcus sp. MIT S9220]|nr:hypothetical protein SynMITS9220_01845 [Synechococcus sp. MIT S9220]